MTPSNAAEHHRRAAAHHEKAAKHHREAAKHHDKGDHASAAHHAHVAHGHHLRARDDAEEAVLTHLDVHGDKTD
ncbi:MAG TPA: hypothetical protein VEH62_13730 [Gemmatimonadales bacterium]|nr:hypothetical protein [Gemmatimonadales bacterium]